MRSKQKNKEMNCPTCNIPKEQKDFYWNKATGFKVDSSCKECIAKRYVDNKVKKAKERKKYFQY